MPGNRTTDQARTLYRLTADLRSFGDVLRLFGEDDVYTGDFTVTSSPFDLAEDVRALKIIAQGDVHEAGWLGSLSHLTGSPEQATAQHSSAVVAFFVDGAAFALAYGNGRHLIPEWIKDERFGLSFAVRAIDAKHINGVTRRTPAMGGRTDITQVTTGAPWPVLVPQSSLHIVNRLAGVIDGKIKLSCVGGRRAVRLDGGIGLRARFGRTGRELIADVREIMRVLREDPPAPGFEFVDHLVRVSTGHVIAQFEADLEQRLERNDPAGLALVAPVEHHADWAEAGLIRMRIGSPSSSRDYTELRLDDVLRRTRVQPDGKRVSSLKRGEITLYADANGHDALAKLSPYSCLEVSSSWGSHRFALVDGHWYEVDAGYLAALRDRVSKLFTSSLGNELPAWDRKLHRDERAYNESLPALVSDYANLDRALVRNQIRRSSGGLEVCDGFGRDEVLYLVKKADSSKSISHLCMQAVNAVRSLSTDPHARAEFSALVAKHGLGRTVRPGFVPHKAVMAILDEENRTVTPDTLPPFAVLSLAETADILAGMGVTLEVISISPEE